MYYISEVNFVIDNKRHMCPVFYDEGKFMLYISPDVYDALDEDIQDTLKYASKNILYKETLFNSYIIIEKDVLEYYDGSERKTVVVTNRHDCTKRGFVMNYIDGLFDILSTDWHILKYMISLKMHVCCNHFGDDDHVHASETSSTDLSSTHCILESYDLMDKVNVLRDAIYADMNDEFETFYRDEAYYPDIEDILGRFTKMTDDQAMNNALSRLGKYGVWNLSEHISKHAKDQPRGLYVVFECEYEKHRVKTAPNEVYTPTGYGCIPDALRKPEFDPDCHGVVFSDWSGSIPLTSNDFIISSYNRYNKVNKVFMERTSRPIEVIKIEKQVIKEVESTLKETIVKPAFYQTIANAEVLEIVKNRYNVAINIFNHASYIKDKVLYIQIGKTTFNEVGRNQNHIIFQIDGNVVKDKEGVVNIIDDDNNVIYTQKYKLI